MIGDMNGEKFSDAASTGFDIDSSMEKVAGLTLENLKKMELILGKYSTDEINIEN
jgi:hypothetical protein